FRLIAVGFLLLTFTLISGVFFSDEIFGKPLRFTHHIVLSLIGWSVFGVLIYGRWRYGWRGRMAVGWTVAGFMLLVLGYFGSKFVFEVLLGR
ncbi:MAG: cytochrome c biogenesis protein CcsA, partial [Gammaproteobacteria bacterium]|nr:cytochrome c biogenesis protein CcsA [Gammaproteobacteria bacterium]